MGMRAGRDEDREAIADADASLRSISRLFSVELAALVVFPGERMRRLVWGETQIAAQQRRLDRTLHVDLGRGKRRLLHIEWAMRLNNRVREQAAQYHTDLVFAVRRDARRRKRHARRTVDVGVESVVVVLTGRKQPWPRITRVRTSCPGKPFSGVRLRIEAVYQQTVAELEGKGGFFWLAFAPLAVDADEEKLGNAIELIRARADQDTFVEVMGTMLSMAQLRKKDRPSFVGVIRSAATKEERVVRHPWFVDGFERGEEKGREEGLAPLLFLFERRLARPLRESERKRIELRLLREGPEKLGAVVLDLSREELQAWLAPRKPAKKRAA